MCRCTLEYTIYSLQLYTNMSWEYSLFPIFHNTWSKPEMGSCNCPNCCISARSTWPTQTGSSVRAVSKAHLVSKNIGCNCSRPSQPQRQTLVLFQNPSISYYSFLFRIPSPFCLQPQRFKFQPVQGLQHQHSPLSFCLGLHIFISTTPLL